MNQPTPSLKTAALLLIVLGALLWLTGLAAGVVVRGPYWRIGIGLASVLVFVGCCLWHIARRMGGDRP